MPEVILSQPASPASAQARPGISKTVAGDLDSSEISDSSEKFSDLLDGEIESTPATSSQSDSQPPEETPVTAELASEPPPPAAKGNALPLNLVELLPDDLQHQLQALPEQDAQAVVAELQNQLAAKPLESPQQLREMLDKALQNLASGRRAMPKMIDGPHFVSSSIADSEGTIKAEGTTELLRSLKQILAVNEQKNAGKPGPGFHQLLGQGNGDPLPALTDKTLQAASVVNGLSSLPSDTLATGTSAKGATLTTQLQTPFQQPGWDNELSERIVWMTSQKLQRAEIKMNPPQLGPIEVRLHISGDQAQVHFSAHHGVVRDALESALPRLRDMFGANGLDLVDVGVSGQSLAQREKSAGHEQGGGNGSGVAGKTPLDEEDEILQHGMTVLNTSTHAGAIDYFA